MVHSIEFTETTTQPSTEQEELDGDWYDEGSETEREVVSVEPDKYDLEEGLTAVDLAVRLLEDRDVMQPNCTTGRPRWYTSVDDDVNCVSGERTSTSAHLIGFTDDEEDAVAAALDLTARKGTAR